MDLIDKKIICELDLNCRESRTKIARKLRIGRSVVDYRIKKLEDDKIIKNYICSINLGLLGYNTYKVYFKIKNSKSDIEKRFLEALLKDKNVIHLLKTTGIFDYSATIAVKNIKELDEFILGLKEEFKEFIMDYSISIIIYSRIFKLRKLLIGQREEILKIEKYSSDDLKEIIDEKDELILKKLSQNANISIIGLAEKTKLTLDIIKYRLKMLNNKRLINSYRVILDFNKLGYYHYVIMLRMRGASKSEEKKLIDWCVSNKRVLYCTKRIGDFDFEVNAAITDINDFNTFFEDLKDNFGSLIDSYEIIINNKLMKLNYVPFN